MKALVVVLFLFPAASSWAKKSQPTFKPELSTEMTFTGADVSGRYNSRDEALAAVENEKSLSDLLSLRKNFKDRVIEDTKKK